MRSCNFFLLCLVAWGLAGPPPAIAQFSRFGKNKVQFAEFKWQKLETPHFDVYFFREEEQLAAIAAHMADSAYTRLERKFGYTLSRRVPLILYSSHIYFEQTNIIPTVLPEGVGGFTEFFKGRVALPLDGSLPEFRRVLTHELVHVFTFDRIRHVLRIHGVTEYRMPPLWLSEGIAEFWSGYWSTRVDMVLRDALFAERLVPISRMSIINGSFLMYKEGQSICRYMAETYGSDVFERIFTHWWRGRTFAEVFQQVTGDPLSKLDRDWQYALRKRYLPEIARGDLPSQAAEQLTEAGFNAKPAVVAAHGDTTTFVHFSNQRGYTYIAQSTVPRSTLREIASGERSPSIESLHPLSSRLAVSPDGCYLAYAAKHRGRDHLYVFDLHSRRQVHDLCFAAVVAISSPSWSPDGASLVFSGASPAGMTDLYTVHIADGTLRQLTSDPYDDEDPSWSGDGSWIAFSSDRSSGGRDGWRNLFVVDAASGELEQLTQGAQEDVHPSWNSDGSWIAFSSNRDTIPNIYVMRVGRGTDGRLRHGPAHRITQVLTGAFDPAWEPGDEGFLFSGYEGGTFQIFHQPVSLDSLRALDGMVACTAADTGWVVPGMKGGIPYRHAAYRRHLSLDVAQSQISQDPQLGTSGGIELGLSDVLGNEQYYFILSQVAGSEAGFFDGMNLTFAQLRQGHRVSVLWGVFRLNDRLTSRYGRYVRERRLGGFLQLAYPLSRYDRVVVQFSLRHARVDRRFEGQRLRGWLTNTLVSYTHDSSLWIPTGPLEGQRYTVGVSQTLDYTSSRRLNVTLFGDYRRYVRLSARSALAMRVVARQSCGVFPEYFSLGGSWTLRGYPWMSIWGSKMFLVSQELRFPLVDRLVVGFPFGNIDFSAFRGALFVDAGNAWTDSFGRVKGSFGGGVRLALGGAFVFRLDGARRTDFRSVGNDTHWEFFFGWDF